MRLLCALAGLHRYDRGAELTLIAIAERLARGGDEVTLIGSGEPRPSTPYRFIHAGSVPRERLERMPRMPPLRGNIPWEEASFIPNLLRVYRPADYDLTFTCGYPFTNWALRRPRLGGRRPAHVFVTQNGDYPAQAKKAEYRWFGCEGLICINTDYYERNRRLWPSALIPNGIDVDRFKPGAPERARFGLPAGRTVVLMVSALIESKRVEVGIEAVANLPGAHLVVAGDGPLRDAIDKLAADRLPGRYNRLTVAAADMPALYRSADIFLHLSLDESFGNVFLEALACGLPVVAEDSSRTRWIVGDGEPLVDTRNVAAVTAALGRAAAEAEMRSAARVERAAGFSWDRVAELYRDFFRQVLDGTASRSRA